MKKYIVTSLFILSLGAGLAEAAKQSMLTVGETTHGDVRTTVNTNATRSNSNFTELYARKQTGVTDWTTNGAGYTYAEDDLVKYGDKIYIALGAHVQDVATPDTSEDFAEWAGSTGTGAVSSVNTETGDVVLDADDISDTTTTNKFVTAADITKLSNLSGTNTGDQDLSSYATKANVLELNNTTSFTPDADYEPATKKYVDDSITAGGGYTDEQAQDATGSMVTGNTETGISVAYDDATGKLNFVVVSQTDNNFTTAYKSKLDGIAESADVDTDDQVASEVPVTVTAFNGNLTASENTVQKALDKIDDLSIGGSYTDEQAQDAVGAMVTGNTETGISVTYDDATAKLNFVVDDDLQDLSDGSISYSKVTPPGSDTQVIFNDATAFGGDSGLTYNKTTDTLTVVGAFAAPTFTINASDTARKLLLPNNTSYTPVASENSIYTEANKIKVSENGTEKTVLNSADIGVAGGVQAYNQYLPTWPSSVSATEVGFLDGVTSAIQTQITGKENSLGNPGTNGWVLSSTTTGTRSWIAPGGMTYPLAGIPNSTGSAWGTSYTLDTDLTSVSASDDTLPSAKATKAALDLKANATGIAFQADALTDLKILDTGTTYTALVDDTVTYGSTYDAKHLWSVDKVGSELAGKQASDADLTTLAAPGNWKVFYSNGSGAVVALGLGSDGQYLKSNGASSIPSWATPTSTGVATTDIDTSSEIATIVTDETGTGSLVFGTSPTFTTSAIIADSGKLIFDESATDPNDADIELSATDGVFKIASANGANNEDLTVDLDQTANTAIIGSSTGLTLITTGSIPLNGAIKVIDKDADYTIGTDNANEAYGAIFFNTAASTRTFTLPSAAAGMSVCVRNLQGVSQILRLDAATGDYIVKSTGARTSASGEYYGATADAKNQVCVVARDSTDWYVTSEVGTWTEE